MSNWFCRGRRGGSGGKALRRICGAAGMLLVIVWLAGCSDSGGWLGRDGKGVPESFGPESPGASGAMESFRPEASGASSVPEPMEPEERESAEAAGALKPGEWKAAGALGSAEPEIPRYDIAETGTESLPRRYDGREQGRTAPVKDQGELGTCWAFASMLSLENALLPLETWDFSEDHMSHDPSFHLGQENGGEYTMAMAYLLSWRGPVTEEQDPYGDGFSPENLQAVKHVQQVQVLPAHDRERIKRAVMTSGGVQSSMYTTIRNQADQSRYYNREAAAYCYPEETAPNHDVVIVGWDDDFPKELFSVEVPEDGAFICENSWGTWFGDEGFFYVSYFDGNLGKNNAVYTEIETPDNYDRIYQSDLCGWIGQLGYGQDTAWGANVYEAESEELLKAAGFYAVDQATEYEIYVMTGVSGTPQADGFGERRLAARGMVANAGFYTISLTEGIMLEPGERFAVMVRLTTPGVIHPIAVEYDAGDGKCRIDLTDGEGYISLDGELWERVEETQNCNICLKAYTQER